MAANTREGGRRRGATGGACATRRILRTATALALAAVLLAVLAAGAAAREAGGGQGATPLTGTPAPKITQQPASVTVEEGSPASFTSSASNSPTISWEMSTDSGSTWHPIEGATSETYSIPSTTTAMSGYEFRAVFTNAGGTATSKAATLTVTKAPQITLQPADAYVQEGHEATFEAAASGFPAPTCQWQNSTNGGTTWKNVVGATKPTYKLSGVGKTEEGWKYRAVFKNSAGEATTQAATLLIVELPHVQQQPLEDTVTEGETAEFHSDATGSPAPTEQWEVSTDDGATFSPIGGATSERLQVPGATVSESGYLYRAAFTNRAGTVYSSSAKLTVDTLPVVTEQPASTSVLLGASATFHAAASGTPAPSIQWQVSTNEGASWENVAEATGGTLTVADAQLAQNGNEYRALFTNRSGSIASEGATLGVASAAYRGYGWGGNARGQAGVGSSEAEILTPVTMPGLSFVTAVAAGTRHGLALLADGTVEAWGFNGYGQLGNAGELGTRSPVAIEHLSRVKAIAAGANHSVALLDDGAVEDWGDNESGQLGNGSTTESEVPVAVPGVSGATAIAAGKEHTLALLQNGTVLAWGNNERGQLGDGNRRSSDTPVAVKGLTGAVAIAAGGNWSMALLEDGQVVAWGDDDHGQLGNREVDEMAEDEAEPEGRYATSPVPVEDLTGVRAIAAGDTHALALLDSGAVVAWGDDREGEVGNGALETIVEHPEPVGLTGVTAIAAGEYDSAAIREGGLLYTWGTDSSANLGLGTHGAAVDTPTRVSTLGMVAGVSAGGSQMNAFGEAVPVVASIAPSSGAAAGGTEVTITGTGFTAATAVHFGSAPARSFEIRSATTIVAFAPAGSGTVDVTVSSESGTSGTGAPDRFTYIQAPTITKLSAKGGPASGGTAVTITGTNFSAGATVTFGGVQASSVTVNSSTSITAVSPQNPAGTLPVAVTTGGGTSAPSSKARFKYTPVVEAVEPATGPLAGGNTVTVRGAGFAPGTGQTSFKFGHGSSKSVQCESSTVCSVLVPAGKSAGTVDVVASAAKAKGKPSTGDTYTYE